MLYLAAAQYKLYVDSFSGKLETISAMDFKGFWILSIFTIFFMNLIFKKIIYKNTHICMKSTICFNLPIFQEP